MMRGDLRRRWAQFSDAMAECRRAEEQWTLLQSEIVGDVEAVLSEKEARHMTHTVFRINALLFLYSRLRGTEHDTRLGVLLGAITHLLDYVYDHHAESPVGAVRFEELVHLGEHFDDGSPIERVLRKLAAEAWDSVADPELLRVHLDAMLETQRASMAQEDDGPLSTEALEQLTQDKGHRSLCLFFAAVNATFDFQEETALRRFGLYMQYMDDLEDYYEDQSEARLSPIRTPLSGAWRASRLLVAACPDLRHYYGSTSRRRYRIFMTWVSVFHAGILLACATREVTRRLPDRPQMWIDRFTERLARRNPFFNVAPVGLTYCDFSRASPARSQTRRPLSVAATTPVATWTMWVESRARAVKFATVVDPILAATVADRCQRAEVRTSLLEWALKGGYMVGAYTRLADLPPQDELALLCGAAGRLYDDLLESGMRPELADRLSALFEDEDFEAHDDLEALLAALYTEIRVRLGRERSDPVFRALAELHAYQERSSRQRDPDIPPVVLDDITFHKGALTVEVLYAMARVGMSPIEREVIHLIGGTFQLVDDYQDVWWDREAGFTTKATRGEIHWSDLWARLDRLEQQLVAYYDPRRAARFVNEARIQLLVAWIASRRTSARRLPRMPENGRKATPLRLLLRRGSNVPVNVYPTGRSVNGGHASRGVALSPRVGAPDYGARSRRG
jgi:hypothetical protein